VVGIVVIAFCLVTAIVSIIKIVRSDNAKHRERMRVFWTNHLLVVEKLHLRSIAIADETGGLHKAMVSKFGNDQSDTAKELVEYSRRMKDRGIADLAKTRGMVEEAERELKQYS
jgi:hypothetical protein